MQEKTGFWKTTLRSRLFGATIAVAALPILIIGASSPNAGITGVERHYGADSDRCYDCEPPDIIDVNGEDMDMTTTDQGGDPHSTAKSYFGGTVQSYDTTPQASQFNQSTHSGKNREDWLFAVKLDEQYTPTRDLAIAIRKVDEPVPTSSGGSDAFVECPETVPNVENAYISFADPYYLMGQISEDWDHCESYFPGPNSWHRCHYDGEDWPYLPSLIVEATYHLKPEPECPPAKQNEEMVCVEISDLYYD